MLSFCYFSKVSYGFHILLFFLRLFGFSLISRVYFNVQRRSIYPYKAIEKAGDIGWFNFQSVPFFRVKNVENGTEKTLHVPFSLLLTKKKGTDLKSN